MVRLDCGLILLFVTFYRVPALMKTSFVLKDRLSEETLEEIHG